MGSTKIGQLAQEMSATNPWWRDTDWESRDADLQAAEGHGIDYQPEVLEGIQRGGLYLLRGPRRVGKTVSLKRKISELLDRGVPPTCIVRAAVDGWAGKDVRTLVQNTTLPPMPEGQTRWWFLDEISATTGQWDRHVKWLRDNHHEFAEACVVLTGSDAGELARAAGTLAGRRGQISDRDRTLLPMGFRTFMQLGHQGLPDVRVDLGQMRSDRCRNTFASLLPWLNDLVRGWDLYLQYGGFPSAVAAAQQGQPVPQHFLQAMMDVIGRDAFASSRLSRAQATSLLDRLWGSMSTPANLSSIAQDVGTSTDTVTRHVQYLRDAYLLWVCPQKHPQRWVPRDGSQSKLYAIDPLVARLAHLLNSERPDIDPTVLTEMMIGVAVHRARTSLGRAWEDDPQVFFARTPARKEIDFVSSHFGGAALEAKHTEGGNWRSEAATVNASAWDGILVTRNVLDTDGRDAWAVPASVLAYLLDT